MKQFIKSKSLRKYLEQDFIFNKNSCKIFTRNVFNSVEKIQCWLKSYNINYYRTNNDLSVDVAGSVNLSYRKLLYIPINFNVISGSFSCVGNYLESLDGSPRRVEGHFWCNKNNLKSLRGSPNYVAGEFICAHNSLSDLVGSPKYVELDFNCGNNDIITLCGAPSYIGGRFFV